MKRPSKKSFQAHREQKVESLARQTSTTSSVINPDGQPRQTFPIRAFFAIE
jgi:hypothetical protein